MKAALIRFAASILAKKFSPILKPIFGIIVGICFMLIILFGFIVTFPMMTLFGMLQGNEAASEWSNDNIAFLKADCVEAVDVRLNGWIKGERQRLEDIPISSSDIDVIYPEEMKIDYQDALILYNVKYGMDAIEKEKISLINDGFINKHTEISSVTYQAYEEGGYVTKSKPVATIKVTFLSFIEAQRALELTPEQSYIATNMYIYQKGQTYNPASFSGNDASYTGGDLTFLDGGIPIIYYSQRDERWGNQPYDRVGNESLGTAGCAPTSLAIAITSILNQKVLPKEVGDWAYLNGYVAPGQGSYNSLIPAAIEHYGGKVSSATTKDEVLNALRENKAIIAIMGTGHFTPGGHFIVLRGLTSEQKVLVADPVSLERSYQEWDINIILAETNKNAGSGGPLWIVSK